MRAVLYTVPALSLLVLGAHFLRQGGWLLPTACVMLAVSLAWQRGFVMRLIQVALALGAVEWAWTAYMLVQQRVADGRPWMRMAIILGVGRW